MQTTHTSMEPKKASATKATKQARLTPKADIFETETTFGILLDLPGVGQDSIEISLQNQLLTVEAGALEVDKRTYFRRFRLNCAVDRSGIRAQLKNGVLELVLPKPPESQRKTISISTD